MANTHLTPAYFVDEVVEAEIVGDRAVITFASYGAEIRLSLSRNAMIMLVQRARRARDVMLEQEDEFNNVISMPKRIRAKAGA
jgi:hypothetical protein